MSGRDARGLIIHLLLDARHEDKDWELRAEWVEVVWLNGQSLDFGEMGRGARKPRPLRFNVSRASPESHSVPALLLRTFRQREAMLRILRPQLTARVNAGSPQRQL